jgi:pimeloyl-ACP methyl ester carboxylesterase
VEYFADQGYGIIAPDLLGYGGSSKPEVPENYTAEAIGSSLVEVVQQVTRQQSPQVIGVGHDWQVNLLLSERGGVGGV